MDRKIRKIVELAIQKEGVEKFFESLDVSDFELLKHAYKTIEVFHELELSDEECLIFNQASELYWEHSSSHC